MMNETTQLSTGPVAVLRTAFDHVAEFFATLGAALNFAREAEWLARLSDADLERLGIRRDEIGAHLSRQHLAR